MTEITKIYISGKITGTDDYMERFKRKEEELKERGYTVINPAAVNSMLPKGTTYEQYMQMSMLMIDMCDAVYMMNGWETSCGANREYGYAVGKDMGIMMED